MPSRVGKRPIDIPSGVQVTRDGTAVKVKGPNDGPPCANELDPLCGHINTH